MRSLYYAANKEKEMKKWYTDNIYCEVNAYPETGKYAILNNANRQQVTNFYDGEGKCEQITLKPCEILWR